MCMLHAKNEKIAMDTFHKNKAISQANTHFFFEAAQLQFYFNKLVSYKVWEEILYQMRHEIDFEQNLARTLKW